MPAAALGIFLPLVAGLARWRIHRKVNLKIWRWWIGYWCGAALFISTCCFAHSATTCWLELPKSASLYVPTTCRVISKDVDLRVAKSCKLVKIERGASPPVNFPHLKQRYELRCYSEYYWASILEVEFWTHASSAPSYAASEAPSGLLPGGCRPGFSAAWQTTRNFKVNATYPCKFDPSNLAMVDLVRKIDSKCAVEKLTLEYQLYQIWLQ
eukprot:jgi/Mesen1/5152/ME000255S04120